MHQRSLFAKTFASIAFIVGLTITTPAQSNRTWVASNGNDANSCSRMSPCKTFAGAISRTNVNGEINCVNPDGYGAVTITKSVTIDCEDTQGATLASFVSGIVVNLGAMNGGDPQRMVRLRGITINGTGGNPGEPGLGIRGIDVNSANTAPVTLHIDQVVVNNFAIDGIQFNASGGEVLVRNTLVQNCDGSGLMIDSNDPALVVHATVEGSSFIHNRRGIQGETAARITISNSNISNNSREGVLLATVDASQSEANLYNCFIAGNKTIGVSVDGNTGIAIVRLDGNHIVNNIAVGGGGAKGVQATGNGQAFSRGNNTIKGNDIDVDTQDPNNLLLNLPNR